MGEATVGTVTVMFTDLAGSTELRTRVGEDGAEVLRGIHDSIVTGAVSGHGGQIVKHLGDGVMATFTSAAGAVAAAVAMQQDLDLHNRHGNAERMQIRVGISTGDVTFEGDDCFGLPVVEAQRLEASAAPATIRCAEMVMLMARGRGGHEFRPLGSLELKGLAEPLAASEVVWVPLATPASPAIELSLPPVFAHGGGLPFSGREAVFEELVDAWKRCAAGGFEVVLLAGEPGIGKTRLAQELATRVHGGSGVVLGGRCDEDVTAPFQAFAAALDWYVKQGTPDELGARLGAHPGDLVRLVPDLAQRVTDLPPPLQDEPGSERLRLFQAVESWLGVGGAELPRLLVLDDLHWADKPSLLLLRHLLTNPPAGLMVLCTYRDTDVDRSHPLAAMLADFRRMPAVTRIALDGLGDDGVRDLLARTGGHELDDAGLAFAGVVQRETSGNPFFVGEVLRHLAETGALVERDGRWTSDLRPEDAGIPEGIREVVGRRLSRLGDDVEAVLRSAAVIGYEFDVDLLADVAGRDVDDVLDALDVAAAANLAIEVGVGRHRFAHALVRETLHDELSATRRARQHRRVAEALERQHAGRLDEVVAELATHWIEASAGGDPTRPIELSVAAGDQASARGAFENATTWYERALELMDDDESFDADRRRVTVQLAEAQATAGASADSRQTSLAAARAAIAAGDGAMASDALTVTSRSSFGDIDEPDPEKIALLRDALGLEGIGPAGRAALLGQLATELIFVRDIPGRREVHLELLALLPSLSSRDHGAALTVAGALPFHIGHTRGIEVHEMARAAVVAASTPTRAASITVNRFFWALMVADRASCDEIAETAHSWGGSANRFRSFSLVFDTMLSVLDGDLESARRHARSMVEVMRALDLAEVTNYHTSTGVMIRRERRDLGSLGPVADAAEHLGHPTSSARAIAGFIRLHEGKVDAAAAALDGIRGEELSDDGAYPLTAALWSEIAVALEAHDLCRTLADGIAFQTGMHFVTGGCYLGAVDRVRARLLHALGEHDQAVELFGRSVAQHERLRTPTWVARTHLDWADCLVDRDERTDARAHVEAARAAIGDLDLPDSQHRVDALTTQLDP